MSSETLCMRSKEMLTQAKAKIEQITGIVIAKTLVYLTVCCVADQSSLMMSRTLKKGESYQSVGPATEAFFLFSF